MSKPIWCEIVCYGCAAQVAGQFTYGHAPRKEMDKEAAKAGWAYVTFGLSLSGDVPTKDWACPSCRKNHPQVVRKPTD